MNYSYLPWLLILSVLCVGCAESPTKSPSADQPVTTKQFRPVDDKAETFDEHVSFPSVGIKIGRPQGFEKSTTFDGFAQPSTKSSVMAVRMPGPFSEVSAGFNAKKLSENGMKLLQKESMEVNAKSGVLIHFEQSAFGDTFEKWAVVFGDERQTTLVTATFPKEENSKLSALLKAVVLSTQLEESSDPQDSSTAPFVLQDAGKLKFATEMGRMRLYTIDSKFPVKELSEPIFIAGTSLGNFSTSNQQLTVEKQLQSLQQIKNRVVSKQNSIEIDGLKGLESIVNAEDTPSSEQMCVYHVMLFGDNIYYVLIGMVSRDRFDEFLPEFKSLVASFKRK